MDLGSLYPGSLSSRRKTVTFRGRVTTTTAGTIGSQTAKKMSGYVASHVGTGKYRFTFDSKYNELLFARITVIGANATYTAAKGLIPVVVSDQINNANKRVDIQLFAANGANLAAVVEDGAILLVEIVVACAAT